MRSLVPSRLPSERRRGHLAWIVWLGFLVAVTLVVVLEGDRRSVIPHYRAAARAWWAGGEMYGETGLGFLYLPTATIVYTPFLGLPDSWAGIAWRWAGAGLLAAGVWRLARLIGDPTGGRFLLMTGLILPTLAGSARNGQMNVPMAALFVHAAVDLARARWWRSSASLALAVALKPTALPMAMLTAALFPSTAGRTALLLLVILALPFATAAPAYAWGQYASFINKLKVAGNPASHGWQDLAGMIRALGYEPPIRWMTAVRVLGAGGTLAAGWVARRRLDQVRGALLVYCLGAVYIVLANPRTEGLTYTILIPAVAVAAAGAFDHDCRSGAGWLCVAVAFVLGFAHFLTAGPNSWMRPSVTLVFLGYLLTLACGPYAGVRSASIRGAGARA